MKLNEFWDSLDNTDVPETKLLGSLEARLAFTSGFESQQNGTPKEKNPYNHGERARAWLQGWKAAYLKKYGKQDVSSPSLQPNHPSSDAAASNG